MGDLTVSSATFTTDGMILTGLDDLTSEWGSNMANNTGYLYRKPRTVIDFQMSSVDGSGDVPGEGYVYLTLGTWLLYWAFLNPAAHDYMPGYLRFWDESGSYSTIGTYDWTGSATGGVEAYGSKTYVCTSENPIRWTLNIPGEAMAHVIVQGVKMGVALI